MEYPKLLITHYDNALYTFKASIRSVTKKDCSLLYTIIVPHLLGKKSSGNLVLENPQIPCHEKTCSAQSLE